MKYAAKFAVRFSIPVILTVLLFVFFASCGCTANDGGGGGGTDGGGGEDHLNGPLADAFINPSSGFIGDTLSLDGTGSSDADGTVVDWEWDMGNGSTVFGETTSYTYTEAGDYTVTLTVTDNDGRTGSTTVLVSISDGSPLVDIGGPYGPLTVDGADNGTVNFTASATPYGGASIADYYWSYGDGTSENGAALSAPGHQYTAPSAPNKYTVTLIVTDSFSRTGSETTSVRVHQVPLADAGGNKSAIEGDTVNFDGSASFDPDSDGSIVSYEWDWENDGTYDDTGVTASYSWSTTTGSPFTVGLKVTDNDGATATDTVEVTVVTAGSNLPPTADPGGPYGAVLVNTPASFDGSASSDSEGSIALYEWDFDYDGTFTINATGQSVSNTYNSVGTYTVALRVTDDDATTPKTDIDTAEVTVHAAPVAHINDGGNPSWVVNGESFTLSASDSLPDGGAAGGPVDHIAEYRWDFDNDGITDFVTSVPTVSHSYSSDGDKTVALTVMDSNGEVSSNTDTYSLTVHQPVIADIGGPYGAAGDNVFQIDEVITLDGSGSDDPDSVGTDTISSYTWDFDYDGIIFHTYATGVAPSRDMGGIPINGVPGNYTMALKVSDPDDISINDVATLDYRVNDPPTASFTHDPENKYEPSSGVFYDALIDEVITFDASGSSDSDGTIATYEWDFDYSVTFSADATGTENGITHSYSSHGSYTAALRVIDNNGRESAIYSLTIDVPESGSIDGSIE